MQEGIYSQEPVKSYLKNVCTNHEICTISLDSCFQLAFIKQVNIFDIKSLEKFSHTLYFTLKVKTD